MVRTRFAPSPTGYLHVGGARTALFSWAYARKHGGQFVLRIEDTDLERSTEDSVQAILDSMRWLELDWDEGPIRQMHRLHRYQEIADRLLREDLAYRCYCSKEELESMREAQRARGEKPRYDGRWRNSKDTPPAGIKPVLRFKNPLDGEVSFNDLVKGEIKVANSELDDLVIMRADGVPTYNFGVVVDDLDMAITHVIRGDDHVNNTPRQINIFRALGAAVPEFAHVPMILGPDGERLSKRHGAVSVMQYEEDGFLPEALVNYLARLGWSHGDEEIFSLEQFIDWFDFKHVSKSPAQFNPEKLLWVNQQYIKKANAERLGAELSRRVPKLGGDVESGPDAAQVAALLRDRAQTLNELAAASMLFYGDPRPSGEVLDAQLTPEIRPALRDLSERFAAVQAWTPDAIGIAIDATLKQHGLKLPKLAMPLRALVFGQTQTPSINPSLALAGQARVVSRLREYLR